MCTNEELDMERKCKKQTKENRGKEERKLRFPPKIIKIQINVKILKYEIKSIIFFSIVLFIVRLLLLASQFFIHPFFSTRVFYSIF